MKWILKAIVQKSISWLPGSQRINYWFQKHITKGVFLTDDYMDDRLIHFKNHLRFWQEQKGKAQVPPSLLELGTGWYPIIPLCYFLAGTERIITIDISDLCYKGNLIAAFQKLKVYKDAAKLQQFMPIHADRWQIIEDLIKEAPSLSKEQIFERLGIEQVVADARKMPFRDGELACIISNNTFEHVYPGILYGILQEFQRVLNKDGIMSHFIDMSDHFAHLDPNITIYNFLKFSSTQWRIIDNSVQPQNRWRIDQYRSLYKDVGIKIVKEENRPGDLKALRTVKIHPEFRHLPHQEVAISHSYVVSV